MAGDNSLLLSRENFVCDGPVLPEIVSVIGLSILLRLGDLGNVEFHLLLELGNEEEQKLLGVMLLRQVKFVLEETGKLFDICPYFQGF